MRSKGRKGAKGKNKAKIVKIVGEDMQALETRVRYFRDFRFREFSRVL